MFAAGIPVVLANPALGSVFMGAGLVASAYPSIKGIQVSSKARKVVEKIKKVQNVLRNGFKWKEERPGLVGEYAEKARDPKWWTRLLLIAKSSQDPEELAKIYYLTKMAQNDKINNPVITTLRSIIEERYPHFKDVNDGSNDTA